MNAQHRPPTPPHVVRERQLRCRCTPEDHVGEGWLDTLRTSFAGLAVDDPAAGPTGSVVATPLGTVTVFDVRGTPQVVRRTPAVARRHRMDLLKVCVQVRGRAVVEQDGEVAMRPGEMALYDTGRPYRIRLDGDWQCAVMTVPRSSLDLPERALAEAVRRPHDVTSGAGRLLATFLRDCAGLQSSVACGRIGEAGVALLLGTLAACGSVGATVEADIVRRQVVDYIQARVGDPELTPARIAAAHHMSLRAAQRLFEGQEHNLAALVRERRLEAVRRDLADPALARYGIATLAARSCVTNQAWLSRAFRDRFGMSPSEYRATAPDVHSWPRRGPGSSRDEPGDAAPRPALHRRPVDGAEQ